MDTKEPTVYDRMMQVYEINIRIPSSDTASKVLYNSIIENIKVTPVVGDGEVVLESIHSNDIVNVIVNCFDYCHEKDYDTTVLTSVFSLFNIFKNLRYATLTFLYDDTILEKYNNMVDSEYEGDKSEIFSGLYEIKSMEIHLCDIFDKRIVDFLNNMFIFYGYIPNDYMTRCFCVDFEFDEYVSFIEMVFSNNDEFSDFIGEDVLKHLILFPTIFIEEKPKIRIVTNYFDL